MNSTTDFDTINIAKLFALEYPSSLEELIHETSKNLMDHQVAEFLPNTEKSFEYNMSESLQEDNVDFESQDRLQSIFALNAKSPIGSHNENTEIEPLNSTNLNYNDFGDEPICAESLSSIDNEDQHSVSECSQMKKIDCNMRSSHEQDFAFEDSAQDQVQEAEEYRFSFNSYTSTPTFKDITVATGPTAGSKRSPIIRNRSRKKLQGVDSAEHGFDGFGSWRYTNHEGIPDMEVFRTPNEIRDVSQLPAACKEDQFTYCVHKRAGVTSYEPFLIRIAKGRERSSTEGLCPYCQPFKFLKMNDSSYLHHLNLCHGIFSDGSKMPKPRGGVKYDKTKKKQLVVHQDGLICPYKQCKDRFIRTKKLEDNNLGDNRYRVYWRHCKEHHNRGKKLAGLNKKPVIIIE